jgi:hypothetical protein
MLLGSRHEGADSGGGSRIDGRERRVYDACRGSDPFAIEVAREVAEAAVPVSGPAVEVLLNDVLKVQGEPHHQPSGIGPSPAR